MYKVALIGGLTPPPPPPSTSSARLVIASLGGVVLGVLGAWAWRTWSER